MLKLFKKSHIIFFLILFICLFTFTYIQVNSQHWSSIFYFDLTIIYNSLSVVSGYFQEYRTHPAYTQFFINGLFFKFLSIFDSNIPSNLDIYINSPDKNLSIQTLYIYARYIHSLFYFLFAIYFFKLANYFKINNYLTYLSLIFFFVTERILYDTTVLRADIISYLLILISIYYLLIYFDEKKIKYLIITSIFLTLSLLAKIQIIFYLPVIYFILIFKTSKLNDDEINEFNFPINQKIKNYYFFLIFLALVYILLQILLNQHVRFTDSNYLDLKLFILAIIILIIFTNIFLYKFQDKKNLLIKFLVYLISFIFFTILSLYVLSLIGIVKLSPYIFLRITNPFHYMTIVSYEDVAKKYVDAQIFILMIKKFFSLSDFNFKITLIHVLNLTFICLVLENLKQKKENLILYFLILLFFYFILMTFNFRYYETYILYSFSIYMFVFIFYLSKLKNIILKSLLIITMIVFNFIPDNKPHLNSIFTDKEFKQNFFSRKSQSYLICSTKKNRFMYWWWARKQNEEFWLDFCNQQNFEFLEKDIKINNIY